MRWLLDNVAGAREKVEAGAARFGTIDSWLTYRLTGNSVHVTDATNASRTLLMDLQTCAWDDELCQILQVPSSSLPEIRSCSEVYGKTQGLGFLPDGIPVAGIAGDQQAALFGQACFDRGEAKCTYGTGCFLLMNTGSKWCIRKTGCSLRWASNSVTRCNTPWKGRHSSEGPPFNGCATGCKWFNPHPK